MPTDESARIAFASAGLKEALLRRLPAEGALHTAIPGVFAARRDHAGVCEHRFDLPLATLLVQGAKKISFGANGYALRENQVLLVGMAMPSSSLFMEASPAEPLLSLYFHINRQMVGELVPELNPRERHAAHQAAISVEDADADFMEAMLKLAHILDRPEQIPVRAGIALRDLHYLLLTGPHSGVLQDIYANGRHGARLHGAIEYLRERLDVQVGLPELARAVHMSQSTLYRHFKLLTGLSPLQYHKQLRLHEARRLILAENEQASMAAIRVGYESATQFNREYKRLFGQPPLRSRKHQGG